MKDLINLKSRGEEYNCLKRLSKVDGSNSNSFKLKTSTYYIRAGYVDKNKKFIDPPGGPMIVEGEYLDEAGACVKSIDFIAGTGYIITFEPDTSSEDKELINEIVNI